MMGYDLCEWIYRTLDYGHYTLLTKEITKEITERVESGVL